MAKDIIHIKRYPFFSQDRASVIEVAVIIESAMSQILEMTLTFGRKPKSFGDTSQSLSFNQKVTLITDLKGFGKEDADLLVKFAEMRNKFAHVMEYTSLKIYFEKQKSNASYLKKNLNLENLDLSVDENCWILVDSQIAKINDSINRLYRHLFRNVYNYTEKNVRLRFLNFIEISLEDREQLLLQLGSDGLDSVDKFFSLMGKEFGKEGAIDGYSYNGTRFFED